MLSRIKIWRKYYIFYHHNLLYVFALAFSRSLTKSSIISILMVYFTHYKDDLARSAILSNVHDSLSSIFVIFMANIADSCVGRVRTVVFTNTAYIGGLWLMWMFNPYDVSWLLWITLVLLALGTSGAKTLNDIFFDLVKKLENTNPVVEDIDESEKNKRSKARAALWLDIADVSAAIFAILLVAPFNYVRNYQSWRSSFLTCLIAVTLTLLISCKGYNDYDQDELIERPIVFFFRVCRDGIQKLLKSDYWSSATGSRNDPPSQNLESTTTENERTTQDAEVQHDRSSYHQKDLKVVVSLLRIFPVWAGFLAVSLISASGSTFFFEQEENLNGPGIPIQIYSLIQDGSSFAILFLYRWASCSHKNAKVKIGVGMIFSIICCIMAWQLEVHRLKAVRNLDDQTATTSISFLWLMPQFCMLGCMEGLTSDGLLKFFKSQINNKDFESTYGEEYKELVIGFGKLLNIVLILIFKSHLGWFSDTINHSRLDKYYKMLVCACLLNLVYYCVIAIFWFKDAEENNELVNDDSQQRLDPSGDNNNNA